MISIIICLKDSSIKCTIKSNIGFTIGIPFEIIWIDNSENKMSIFEAYNEGVKLSNGSILCFMHEDIVFHSNNWGKIVLEMMSDESVGLLGKVGSAYVSKVSTAWTNKYASHGNLIQGYYEGKEYKTRDDVWDYTSDNQVIAVDGLWMCIRKKLFTDGLIRWDSTTFKGFHFYDFDISLQIYKAGYKALTADSIVIEHKSRGNINEAFLNALLPFHQKWDYMLPVSTPSYHLSEGNEDTKLLLEMYRDQHLHYLRVEKTHYKLLYRIITKIYSLLGVKIDL